MFSFRIYAEPAAKGSVSVSKAGKVFHTGKSKKFEKAIRDQIDYHGDVLDGPVSLTATFFIPRGKTVKREFPHTRGFDLDKGLRALCDSIQGALIKDDSQIVAMAAYKLYEDENRPVGVEFEIEEI